MLPLNRALCTMLAGVLVTTMPAAAQVRAGAAAVRTDSVAIRATALDYIEGWYAGDAARMERSLHPHLAKRFVEPRADGGIRLTETTALELVQQVRNGGGSATPGSVRRTDIRILDIFQSVASVRVDAHGWIDYMHLAKFGDSWRIVNVLWEPRALSVAPTPGGAQVSVQDSTDIAFSITGLRGPEAVRYDADHDVYFVANFGEAADDQRDANGFIARVSAADGSVEALRFMTGTAAAPLHMPRGMYIRNDTLWVADVDGVHGFLSRTGAHAAFIDMTVHEPGFLNDIAAGPDGLLYVTDTGDDSTIHVIDGEHSCPLIRVTGRRRTSASIRDTAESPCRTSR